MAALPPQAAATVPTVRWWPGCWACCQTMNASRQLSLAQQAGLDYTIGTVVLRGAHPNTALLRLEG